MSGKWLLIFTFVVLSVGCVPVTNPVGDIDKAEPDKELLGTWQDEEEKQWRMLVDRPEVKGNPKGLMRLRCLQKGKKLEDLTARDEFWFFTATVGNHTYVNSLVGGRDPELGTEGMYAQWAKSDKRGYYVCLLTLSDGRLSINPGDSSAFAAIMKKEKFTRLSNKIGELLQHYARLVNDLFAETRSRDLCFLPMLNRSCSHE